MSTSLLYNVFGIRGGYEYTRTDYHEGSAIFSIAQPRDRLRCPHCGSPNVHVKTHQQRSWRTLPIGGRATWISMPIPRVACQECHRVRQVKVAFAAERVSYTRSFERYVVDMSKYMTIEDLRCHLGVSWDVVKGIQKKHLRKQFARPKLKNVKMIAIDEVHLGKKSRFATIVLDVIRGAVIFVGKGRGKEALKPFWRRLKSSRAKIKAVATDMAGGYIAAVQENLPDAAHVFDRFHVVKLFNDKLSDLRRDLYRQLTDVLHKNVLKGIRWLLLKNPENLDDTRNESKRLHEALALNAPLATAYYMKDLLRQFWQQVSKRDAKIFLEDWIRQAETSGIKCLKDMARTLAAHRTGLLAWYDYPISTGPLEATNNKIQLLKRQAFGYRDEEFFHLKIYSLHLAKVTLI